MNNDISAAACHISANRMMSRVAIGLTAGNAVAHRSVHYGGRVVVLRRRLTGSK